MDFGIASVAGITVICYLVGLIVRTLGIDSKWIPCAVGITGAALGALGRHIMPDYPADNMITAIAVGIVSGLAATGANQIYKQLRPASSQKYDGQSGAVLAERAATDDEHTEEE